MNKKRAGVVIGATVGGMRGTEQALETLLVAKRHRFGAFRFHECASSTDLCARKLGLRGPCATVSTACSAGAMALAMAAELIEAGEADLMLAGGADALCGLTLNGFGSLLLLDPCGCRPFDTRRAGISLGEGAGMLVIETEEHARNRGARILARLSGWGGSCDAWHPTAPRPDGRGAVAAMQEALASAELKPSDIGFVSAHGTGTPDNDRMEATALLQLFTSGLPPVASVKRFFGHTLAASGAIKAVVATRALVEQAIPPSLGFAELDPKVGFEPVRDYTKRPVAHVLSNSFGFGGNNVALVLSRAENAVTRSSRPRKPAPPRRLAITGMGLISAAGTSTAQLASAPTSGRVILPVHQAVPVSGDTQVSVYACGDFGADELIEPAKKRRLSRFQQMALVAARRSWPQPGAPGPDRVGVGFGTGLGSLNDTAAFLENMILQKAPRPLFFTNSVHNTLAAQVAMEFGCQGRNSTPVHREISFEIALWQMARALQNGVTDSALVGAADELSPYQLMAGVRWGWWKENTPPIRPFTSGMPDRQRPLPGEGCGCVMLCRDESDVSPLGHLSAVAFGRTAFSEGMSLDAVEEAKWLREQLERQGQDLQSVDLLLTGANGSKGDADYAAVGRELSRLAGRPIACGAYKQWCGEFASASAIGFVVALGLVRGEIPVSACVLSEEAKAEACPPRHVVLYTLARGGTKSMCGVTA